MPRFLRLLPAFAALLLAAPLPAQDIGITAEESASAPLSVAMVKASLVADHASVAPGESFTLGLVLDHPEHWHTYWKNPGEAGTPTTVEWTTASGATFGEWRLPAPHLYEQAGVLNYVFEGRAVILIPAKAPVSLKPGDTLKLAAKVEWLECDDKSCNPKSASLKLSLPVTAAGAPANAELFAAAESAIPENAPAGSVSLEKSGDTSLKLTVAPGALAGRDAASAKLFPLSEKLPTAFTTQKPVVAADGSLAWTLPDAAKVKEAGGIEGVITFAKGRALAVSAGLERTAKTVPASVTPTDSSKDTIAFTFSTAKRGEADASHGLPMILLLAFGGGMLLNIMPCVFPVLGLKIYGFVNKAHADRRKVVAHALVFAAGIVVSFWILAAAIIALKSGAGTLFGSSDTQIGWGFLLQSPVFVLSMAMIFLIMALSMAGVFEFGTGVQNAAGSVEDKGGYAGSFLSGVLATLVATPCSGPGIAPAIGAAFASPAPEAFAIFTAMAVGLALPFVALAASPKLMKRLPRPGPWMESFKQGMSFLLFGTLAYFVWILSSQLEGFSFLIALFALVFVSCACWIYGRWAAPHRETKTRRIAKALAAFLIVGSWFFSAFLTSDNVVIHVKVKVNDNDPAVFAHGIRWEDWSPEAQAKALAEGRTVYVDFTARWCATCQVNKRVYRNDDVARAFAAKKVVALKADWTKRDPVIARELAKYNRAAIPFNVVLKPGAEPRPLPELLTAGAVLEALDH